MQKTLFVTDLDATLMRNDKSISQYTIDTLNRLIERGMLFTYATARSIHSAAAITEKIDIRLPVITRNGSILADNRERRETEITFFDEKAVNRIRSCMDGLVLHGFITAYIDERERMSYLEGDINAGIQNFLKDHPNDRRLRPVRTEEELFEGEVCYFSFIADTDELNPLYERVKVGDGWTCIYQRDTYHPEHWLELCPRDATKASAIRKLRERYHCERVVVFGDSINDIPMFEAADEAYAVENAMQEIKLAADGIIPGNEDDGVARWLEENFESRFLNNT